MNDLEKKRKAFKPSVIVLKCHPLLFYSLYGNDQDFGTVYRLRLQIFTDYDTANSILEMVKETYPDAYLKEI